MENSAAIFLIAVHFFRFVILKHLSHKLIHINYWYKLLPLPLFKKQPNFRAKYYYLVVGQ